MDIPKIAFLRSTVKRGKTWALACMCGSRKMKTFLDGSLECEQCKKIQNIRDLIRQEEVTWKEDGSIIMK